MGARYVGASYSSSEEFLFTWQFLLGGIAKCTQMLGYMLVNDDDCICFYVGIVLYSCVGLIIVQIVTNI